MMAHEQQRILRQPARVGVPQLTGVSVPTDAVGCSATKAPFTPVQDGSVRTTVRCSLGKIIHLFFIFFFFLKEKYYLCLFLKMAVFS